MRFIALVSGGKDSIYSIQKLKAQGHIPVGLLYMKNEDEYVDSYMYQTVGSEIVKLLNKCLDLPLFEYKTKCLSINRNLDYEEVDNDEVEDLFIALKEIKQNLDFEGVSSGAILSHYQKNRVISVTKRLQLTPLSPLWNRDQKELLKEMIDNGISASLIKVASSCLNKSWLGKDIKSIYEKNVQLDGNYCGEGGEYETIILDCNLFKYRIKYENKHIFCHPDETFENGIVFYLKFTNVYLEKK